jgi:hypothetical protein
LYGAWVKSFSDTHPDLGCASAPVDDQRYDDGRGQKEPVGVGVGLAVGVGDWVGPPRGTSLN